MSSRSILLAVLGLTLSGCVVSDDGRYYDGYYGGSYNVQRYEVYPTYPTYRVYRYDDDRRDSWHHDRYQDRRHQHYAPGYDGRYEWYDNNRRHERERQNYPAYGRKPARHDGDGYQRHDHERNQALARPEQGFSLKQQRIQRQDQHQEQPRNQRRREHDGQRQERD